MKIIPYGRHNITKEDIQAVVSVLRSDWITQVPSYKTARKDHRKIFQN